MPRKPYTKKILNELQVILHDDLEVRNVDTRTRTITLGLKPTGITELDGYCGEKIMDDFKCVVCRDADGYQLASGLYFKVIRGERRLKVDFGGTRARSVEDLSKGIYKILREEGEKESKADDHRAVLTYLSQRFADIGIVRKFDGDEASFKFPGGAYNDDYRIVIDGVKICVRHGSFYTRENIATFELTNPHIDQELFDFIMKHWRALKVKNLLDSLFVESPDNVLLVENAIIGLVKDDSELDKKVNEIKDLKENKLMVKNDE